jgi:4-hydroxy-3-methylbut-2-en-1-yl diphosphate reductase
VQTCGRFCRRVHHIQTAADLCEEWFRANDSVGITAATSTPDQIVDEVERRIRAMDDRLCKEPFVSA